MIFAPMLFPQEKIEVNEHGGEWDYLPHFLDEPEAERLYRNLQTQLAWKEESIRLFGKWIMQPRLTALYGEKAYTYSGREMQPLPFTTDLLYIKDKIEQYTGCRFNAVLCNLYRNGLDSMGWHSDDEKELGNNPVIASLSLGAERKFRLKHKDNRDIPVHKIALGNGSLLLMKGSTQHFWKHEIPKEPKVTAPRINLTFRYIT
ncbi:MAG: alpha-ketoglutarate-dependent dioxygenase AlkB [Flavobacteriales bacterium]|nr:alpha-ketoglutarate-dependent dioxygenase AlkB [Flavobacteriales bacterium]